jgi:hypothetical protein
VSRLVCVLECCSARGLDNKAQCRAGQAEARGRCISAGGAGLCGRHADTEAVAAWQQCKTQCANTTSRPHVPDHCRVTQEIRVTGTPVTLQASRTACMYKQALQQTQCPPPPTHTHALRPRHSRPGRRAAQHPTGDQPPGAACSPAARGAGRAAPVAAAATRRRGAVGGGAVVSGRAGRGAAAAHGAAAAAAHGADAAAAAAAHGGAVVAAPAAAARRQHTTRARATITAVDKPPPPPRPPPPAAAIEHWSRRTCRHTRSPVSGAVGWRGAAARRRAAAAGAVAAAAGAGRAAAWRAVVPSNKGSRGGGPWCGSRVQGAADRRCSSARRARLRATDGWTSGLTAHACRSPVPAA